MAFPVMIFDRDQTDLANNTAKAFHNASDLMRINDACLELSNLFNAVGVSNSVSSNLYSGWGTDAFERTDARLIQMLDNVTTLRGLIELGPLTPDVPEDFNRPTLEKANDIERILHDIYVAYNEKYT